MTIFPSILIMSRCFAYAAELSHAQWKAWESLGHGGHECSPSISSFPGTSWDSMSLKHPVGVWEGNERLEQTVLLTGVMMTVAGRWDRRAMASLAPGMCQDMSLLLHARVRAQLWLC